MNTYTIKVVTSNIKQAGTDAHVYIDLIGRTNSSGKIPLSTSKLNRNPFEQGKTDEFEVKCLDLKTLKRIRIGHDGRGFGAGWHLKEVTVHSEIDNRTWLFECNRWLARDEEDGLIERELEGIELPTIYKEASVNRFDENFSSSKRAKNHDEYFDSRNLTDRHDTERKYSDNLKDCMYYYFFI